MTEASLLPLYANGAAFLPTSETDRRRKLFGPVSISAMPHGSPPRRTSRTPTSRLDCWLTGLIGLTVAPDEP